MKKIFLLLFSTVPASAALVQMELFFSVFSNTAINNFPNVDSEIGDVATFSLIYDNTQAPLSESDGFASYDTSSLVSLEIGDLLWTSSSSRLDIISEDTGVLTPTDILQFRGLFSPPSQFGDATEQEIEFMVQSSFMDVTFLSSLSLPASNDDINLSAVEQGRFSVSPTVGPLPQWVINGNQGDNFSIDIQAIPEPSIAGLFLWSLLFAFRRKRVTQ